MPFNYHILYRTLFLAPSIFPSIWIFSSKSVLHIRWPKFWSSIFSISPSKVIQDSPLDQDWLDLLAVQGTLKSILQHHSSKASIFQHSAFFIAQLWHPHMTSGKIIALLRYNYFGKVMSLLFNVVSNLVITFLPRSKCLLISWWWSQSLVILEPKNLKSVTVSPSIAMKGTLLGSLFSTPCLHRCHDLCFVS